jgi:hypothetical protein
MNSGMPITCRNLSASPATALKLALIILLSFAWIGCGLMLPYPDPLPYTPPEDKAYFCGGDIWRDLSGGEQFKESWIGWVFVSDQNGDGETADEAQTTCETKLVEYVNRAMAPGFDWQFALTGVLEGTPDNVNPLLRKRPAAECAVDFTGTPFTTGGPVGATVVREPPDAFTAVIDATIDGDSHQAKPFASFVSTQFAERYGLPFLQANGDVFYSRLSRHLRFSDFFLEVAPFKLGPIDVKYLYVQSVGTVYADSEAGDRPNPAFYRIRDFQRDPKGKLYFNALGEVLIEKDETSFCTTGEAIIQVDQQAENFSFELILEPDDLDGFPLSANITTSLTEF